MLQLLVTEHQRWEARLRSQAEHPAVPTASGQLKTVVEAGEGSETVPSPGKDKDLKDSTPSLPSYPFANTAGTPHYPARLQKSTSSLATNLASARGIPQSQTPIASRINSVSEASRRRRSRPTPLLSPTSENAPSSSKPTTSPLNLIPPDQPSEPSPKQGPPQEEPFSKFYSGLNTLITRIGSPFAASLAFTSLPVGEEAEDNEVHGADLLPQGWTQGRGRGRNLNLDGDIAVNESFYVVPTSGGTMSYAGVVRRENSSDGPSGDADLRRSVRRSKSYSGQGLGTGPTPSGPSSQPGSPAVDPEMAQFTGHSKTHEELQLENVTLRRTVEHLSRRMQAYQRNNRESENMLKSSILGMSKASNMDILSQVQRSTWLNKRSYDDAEDGEVFSEGRKIGDMELLKEEKREVEDRLHTLEEELKESRAVAEKLTKENEKLKKVVQHMKDKWEKLTERARKREKQSGSKDASLSKVDEGGE